MYLTRNQSSCTVHDVKTYITQSLLGMLKSMELTLVHPFTTFYFKSILLSSLRKVENVMNHEFLDSKCMLAQLWHDGKQKKGLRCGDG